MTTPLLECRALTKDFMLSPSRPFGRPSALRAVDEVSLTLAPGQTLGVVGESGCGKTTLARLLLRLEQPSAGTILFDGHEVQAATGSRLRDYRRQVQVVFQDPFSSLDPKLSVFQSLAEPLRSFGVARGARLRERVEELMDMVGLNPAFAGRYPHEFSGGQRQRIAIARGIAVNPRLVILDEPVAALDVSIRAQILNLLQDIQDRLGISYLMISHDLDVIAHVCDTVAVMYLGRVVEYGSAETITGAAAHPYTEALFSAALPVDPDAPPRRISLRGEVPSPIAPPPGCRFHPRCPRAVPLCAEQAPAPRSGLGQGHRIACHLAEPMEAAVGNSDS